MSGTPQESDDDDPMGGSLGELSSSEEEEEEGGGESVSEGDEHESDLSEGEESDTSDFGDPFEGSIVALVSKRVRRANRVQGHLRVP